MILYTITIAMFVLSTVHVGLHGSLLLRKIGHGEVEGNTLYYSYPSYPEFYTQLLLECINVR